MSCEVSPEFSEADFVLLAHDYFMSCKKRLLPSHGPRLVSKALSDYDSQVED